MFLTGETEVGPIPNNVGLERLRWNGTSVVDLANLSAMYVRYEAGMFTLHAVKVHNSQLVLMRYGDRKRLRIVDGVIGLYTTEEWDALKIAESADIVDNNSLKQDLVQFVKDLTYSKIDTHINNVFGALTTAQKESLKKLYKCVLYLAKSKVKQ